MQQNTSWLRGLVFFFWLCFSSLLRCLPAPSRPLRLTTTTRIGSESPSSTAIPPTTPDRWTWRTPKSPMMRTISTFATPITTASRSAPFIALDVDENTATGFDIFGLGLIGSEAGWQNDFPFTQSTGNFNDGNGMSGDFFGSGAALLAPFADAPSRELAISLDIIFNADGSPVFPDDTIKLLLWTDQGAGDVTAPISYTLAVPEPAGLALGLVGWVLCLFRRRR